MLSRRQVLFTFGALALGGPALARTASDYGILGRRAPELEVDDWIGGNGEPTRFRLADHSGKWIFLKCWQSWCPGCHSHGFPALKRISDAMADNPRVVFAGIQTVFEGHYTNTRDKLRKIQLQYDLNMPMGHDPGLESGRPQTMVDYRTGGTPWMILISPDGVVVFNDFGINAARAIEYLRQQTA